MHYSEIDMYSKYCLEQSIAVEVCLFWKIVFQKFRKLYFGYLEGRQHIYSFKKPTNVNEINIKNLNFIYMYGKNKLF